MITLTRVPRLLVAIAALLLGVMFVAPVWSIRLIAPQYPEGLGLLIRLNTITGVKEHDLNSINSLNHYIGMRPILPEAIPELKYMPWIVAALIAGGLLVALMGRRRLLVAWVVAFAAIGAAGMYDFWRWGYDYGHNLNAEEAIIVVPGMTYQPPLIGTKQLLNFQATSMPHVGATAAGIAFLLAVVAVGVAYRRRGVKCPAAGVLLAASLACAAPVHTIAFGLGKAITFDSVERMRAYTARAGVAGERWVVDATNPGTLVRESSVAFKSDGVMRPPMGRTYAIAR